MNEPTANNPLPTVALDEVVAAVVREVGPEVEPAGVTTEAGSIDGGELDEGILAAGLAATYAEALATAEQIHQRSLHDFLR